MTDKPSTGLEYFDAVHTKHFLVGTRFGKPYLGILYAQTQEAAFEEAKAYSGISGRQIIEVAVSYDIQAINILEDVPSQWASDVRARTESVEVIEEIS